MSSGFTSQIPKVPRGRGARSNASGRYESQQREDFDDGWAIEDPAPGQLDTAVTAEKARVIISRNDSPDVGFSASINPYRGCEHGCIYCYARPAHAYMGLSPGLDFESKLFFKPHAAQLLEKELAKPRYTPELIHIGGNTDPYQPEERRLRITRGVIEVLVRFRHPFSVITKSALIVRDLDLLAEAAAMKLTRVAISITSLDRQLARSMEPRAATPEKRIDAVRRLTQAGVPVTVMFAPCIPGLNDHEMEAVLERAAQAGASGAGYVALRLPLEIKDLFREWLETDHPDRARRVMSLVRQMRGGKDYDAQWGSRMKGEGPLAALMAARFAAAKKRYGLDVGWGSLDASRFHVPPQRGGQMDLFAE
ncbi:MAG: DNA repair photolyase [Phenylobacterium sp. RIFCSPHIGHO2_01_FULL_69_31]|uniref:PA0069 family radical SAM protein n=1 Tax=Phenylobacterium sp. RIFCSPHIGHO2_01_FULL_69_31 TaxID=1801944 RepID=UPI0008AD8062|nr:PA0069 family radical SAM protein [Phenylobacterium sp. RIFCSPHIGHO2_01_FULL_69_31]OHB30384.1 MAG: DNA repair photolyase [Phenylobacterium sp. RIFCSPHIGHO2_01_FULL_69_31]